MSKRLEEGARDYFRRLDEMGGMVKAIEHGFPQRELLDASQRYQREVEQKERIVVGVNDYMEEEERPILTLKIGPEVEQEQIARLSDLAIVESAAAIRACPICASPAIRSRWPVYWRNCKKRPPAARTSCRT